MPLYRVTFTERGGYRVTCRIQAATEANHIALAVQKIWGVHAYWVWVPGSDTAGQVFERVGAVSSPADCPRTGSHTTVEMTLAQRRPRVREPTPSS